MRPIQLHPCLTLPHLFIAYHQPPPFWTLYGHCHARPSGPPVAAPGTCYVEASSLRRGIEPTSRHRALTLYATGSWSHCMSIEDASRCVEGSIELYIELYIEDVEARAQRQTAGVTTPPLAMRTGPAPR